MPGGGTATGTKIGQQTFAALAFAASLGTSQSITGGAAAVTVNLNTEDLDTEGWYTPGSASFQPDLAGAYLITAQLTMASFTGIVTITLLRGAAEIARATNYSTSAVSTVGLSALVTMNGSTDTLVMKVEHTDTGAKNVTAASMSGILLGTL